MKTKTIVFVHGMFMNSLCWEKWVPYYESKGYRCITAEWPGRNQSVEALRKNHPDPQLAKLTLSDVLEHMTRLLKTIDEKPILIGHSLGGLVVQILLQRNLAAAGVALDPAPPFGVFTTAFSFLRANLPVVNPFLMSQPAQMTFEQFQYAFVNTLPLDEQRAVYDRYVVPESRRVPLQSLTLTAKVDFTKTRPPLLITAGEKDHIIPAALNRINFRRYRSSPAKTDFKEFAGRDHFLIGSGGWQEVADYVLDWLSAQE